MARFRTIDPEMRRSPDLDGASVLERYVLVSLISEADDEGRHNGDSVSVLVACFPRGVPSDVTQEAIDAAVRDLVARGLLVAYAAGGREFLALPGWKNGASWQYQYVQKPKPSRIPAPPDGVCTIAPRGRAPVAVPDASDTPPVQRPETAEAAPVRQLEDELHGIAMDRSDSRRARAIELTRQSGRGRLWVASAEDLLRTPRSTGARPQLGVDDDAAVRERDGVDVVGPSSAAPTGRVNGKHRKVSA